MERRTKKLVYSAVAAAIATVCIILTNILPLKVALLMFASVCYYIAFDKAGILFGFLAIAASLLIGFFSFGVSSGFILTSIIFAPYGVLTYFIRKLYYTKPKTAILRVAIMIVFANLALVATYFLGKFVAIDFSIILGYFNGLYIILALVVTLLFVVFDFLYNQLTLRLCKLIR